MLGLLDQTAAWLADVYDCMRYERSSGLDEVAFALTELIKHSIDRFGKASVYQIAERVQPRGEVRFRGSSFSSGCVERCQVRTTTNIILSLVPRSAGWWHFGVHHYLFHQLGNSPLSNPSALRPRLYCSYPRRL